MTEVELYQFLLDRMLSGELTEIGYDSDGPQWGWSDSSSRESRTILGSVSREFKYNKQWTKAWNKAEAQYKLIKNSPLGRALE